MRKVKLIREDLVEFLQFTISTYQKVANTGLLKFKALDDTLKLGASFKIVSNKFKEQIWKEISTCLEDLIQQQEEAETKIYQKYKKMKKEHEDLLARDVPDSWYQKALKVVADAEIQFQQDIKKCIEKYYDLAIEIEKRCTIVQYPHSGDYTDGTDFIRLAKKMDINTFTNILKLKEMFDE